MTKAWFNLDVEIVGTFVFRVESEAHETPHMVDALFDNGLGKCSCKDFENAVAPVRAGRRQPPPKFANACKHIMRVDLFVASQVKQKALEQKQFQTSEGP